LLKDFRDCNGTISAITFCYRQRIDDVKVKNLIKDLWNIKPVDMEYQYFIDYVNLVANTTMYTFWAFNRFVNDKRLEYVDMVKIAEQIMPNVEAYVTSFDLNFKPIIEKVMTEIGMYHTVNGAFSWRLYKKHEYVYHCTPHNKIL
jgi:hypothetical protein